MTGLLAGKCAILTGAAGGQGRIAARLLAEAGASVVLTDKDSSAGPIAAAIGSQALFIKHDVTDADAWRQVIADATERFGGVDVLINNAGIAGRDDVASLSPDRLRHYFDVNVIGALNGIQAVLPAMRTRGRGSIVNVASISALRATPGLVGYGTSKWALRGLTRNAAAELAAYVIRVNLILPGAVDVQMIKDDEGASGKQSLAAQVPLGRVASADEVARTAIFLASDAASYVTGAELTVDGGWCA